MIECRKCHEKFSAIFRLDGKKYNLCNRKFCIKCSPFKCHNTRKDIDAPYSPNSSNIPWKLMSEERKQQTIDSNNKRGVARKLRLINLAGGGCKICGYNKSTRALSFHHRDRSTKSFPLCLTELRTKSEEQIMAEFAKCDLLCMNCHAEEEEKLHKQKVGL